MDYWGNDLPAGRAFGVTVHWLSATPVFAGWQRLAMQLRSNKTGQRDCRCDMETSCAYLGQ
jgi:hypothetical protein